MNKRGFIKTLEAVIAVIIIFVFIFFVGRSSYNADEREIQNIRSLQESMLSDISGNDAYRDCVVVTPVDAFNKVAEGDSNEPVCVFEIKNFIANSLPGKFRDNHEFNVCDPKELGSCTLPTIASSQVYTSAVVITSSLKSATYDPRILRIWFY